MIPHVCSIFCTRIDFIGASRITTSNVRPKPLNTTADVIRLYRGRKCSYTGLLYNKVRHIEPSVISHMDPAIFRCGISKQTVKYKNNGRYQPVPTSIVNCYRNLKNACALYFMIVSSLHFGNQRLFAAATTPTTTKYYHYYYSCYFHYCYCGYYCYYN